VARVTVRYDLRTADWSEEVVVFTSSTSILGGGDMVGVCVEVGLGWGCIAMDCRDKL